MAAAGDKRKGADGLKVRSHVGVQACAECRRAIVHLCVKRCVTMFWALKHVLRVTLLCSRQATAAAPRHLATPSPQPLLLASAGIW